MTSTHLQPREGDICRTSDGHLWRVTRVVAEPTPEGPRPIASVARLGDHIEMAIPCADLTVIEPHPGGRR